jgi:hypothetical protein
MVAMEQQWSVYKWIEKLKNSSTSVIYKVGAGHPSMDTNEDNIERVHDMVLLDGQVSNS